MATIYEVAERAGVSLSTVSRVLNGHKTVNQVLRQKVETAMAELNYRPNSVARSLATNRTDSIGLLVSELNTPYFGEMMKAVENKLREANKHVIITVGHNDLEQERDGVEFLISRNCDALILHVESLPDDELSQINEKKVPIALVNRLVPGMEEACICLDNEVGGYLSAKHLIDQGHTDIGYIAGPQNKVDAQQRLEGHKRALQEAGLPFKPDHVYLGDYTEEGGAKGINALIDNDPDITGVICANDWMASGAMTSARDRGLDVPDDLSIVGFDNVLFAHHIYPKLTTMNNPIDQMGEMAAKFILKQVYKQKETIQNQYSPELVVRQSTKSLN